MNNELLKISLNQGKKFNKYQTKIKKSVNNNIYTSNINNINNNSNNSKYNKYSKYSNDKQRYGKEGFVTVEQEEMLRPAEQGFISVLNSFNNSSQNSDEELNNFMRLEAQYNDMLLQYNAIQKKIGDSSLDIIKRTSSTTNPYLNKNVKFTNNVVAYVTSQGIVKPYPSFDLYMSMAGKNGCPNSELMYIDIPFITAYISGSIIPTNPSLVVGSPMVQGESCGNEGKNVYVSTLVQNVNSSYVGCYSDKPMDAPSVSDDARAMIYNSAAIGYTTFEQCQDYAINNSYQYFGLQDYRPDSGIAACLVSNDLTKTESYGEGLIVTMIELWSSGTGGQSVGYAEITGEGFLGIYSSNGVLIYKTNESDPRCMNGGNISVTNATWGANCNGQGNWSVQLNNALDSVNSVTNAQTGNVVASNYVVGTGMADPAYGCRKNFDVSYVCGANHKNAHIEGEADGQNVIFDCATEVNDCSFKLVLQADGNMCIYPQNNSTSLWATKTNGKQQSLNPSWVASKGKYGLSYLSKNQVLYPGEWIGSDNGSLKLILQTDGNLVLYTSDVKPGCTKDGNGKFMGGPWINAVYKLEEVGNKSVLGKMGYIDNNANLREYPVDMLSYQNGSTYKQYVGYDSGGNDITNINVSATSDCETACTNNDQCAAYVFQQSTNTCWLKNSNAYPNCPLTPNVSLTLGVKRPQLNNTNNCSNDIVDIDTVQYDNYQKGEEMSPGTLCNAPIVSQENRDKIFAIKNEMAAVVQNIVNQMEQLNSENNNIYEKLNMNQQEFKKKLAMYKKINATIKKELEIESKDNIEGMYNRKGSKKEGLLTMGDVNGMIADSDLQVLQENYQYIFLSILAVGMLIVTMNIMKK
jgi:hypothetical protein